MPWDQAICILMKTVLDFPILIKTHTLTPLTLTSSCRALPTVDSAWCSASCHLAEHHLLLIVHGAQHHVVLPSTTFSESHGAEHYEVN